MKKLPVFPAVLYRRLFAMAVVNDRLEVMKDGSMKDAKSSGADPRPTADREKSNRIRPGQTQEASGQVFGKKLGLVSRLVGCSHREMSRPFVSGNTGYRTCLKCGARRQFNSETFETFGKFYAPPVTKF